jgi:hypothetical protein
METYISLTVFSVPLKEEVEVNAQIFLGTGR